MTGREQQQDEHFTSWSACWHCQKPYTKTDPLTRFVVADKVDGARYKRTWIEMHPSCLAAANLELRDGFEWVPEQSEVAVAK